MYSGFSNEKWGKERENEKEMLICDPLSFLVFFPSIDQNVCMVSSSVPLDGRRIFALAPHYSYGISYLLPNDKLGRLLVLHAS